MTFCFELFLPFVGVDVVYWVVLDLYWISVYGTAKT